MDVIPGTSRALRICAVVATVSAVTSAGFALAALFGPGLVGTGSMYAAARSVPLALVAVGIVRSSSRGAVTAIALVMALIQTSDAVVGLVTHDLVKTLGPAVLAVAGLASIPRAKV